VDIQQSVGTRRVDGSYARSGPTEAFRQVCRAADFVLLLLCLRRYGCLSSLQTIRSHHLVELGPGPTRLSKLKTALLRDIRFVDQSDFGRFDRRLQILDLSTCEDAEKLLYETCNVPRHEPVLLFADHCLEHIRPEVLLKFLDSLGRMPVTVCLRVPNIFSPQGERNYRRDSTHKTPFDSEFRQCLQRLGFHIVPFVRWYRPLMMISFLLQPREERMRIADEIMICKGQLPESSNNPARSSFGDDSLHPTGVLKS